MCKTALLFLATVAVAAVAQNHQTTTPVPILRQINSHNDDGSYTYGYEAADGSYKVETKTAGGEVRGKYGYYDDAGSLREIEYGANRNGFNPSGTGIQVPPAVLSNNNNIQSTNPADYDDGQYRPGPDEAGLRYNQEQPQQPAQRAPVSRFSNVRNLNLAQAAPVQQRQPIQQQQNYYQEQQQQQNYYQEPQQQQNYYQEQPQPAYRPVQVPASAFNGHPARNINLNAGSYSVQY